MVKLNISNAPNDHGDGGSLDASFGWMSELEGRNFRLEAKIDAAACERDERRERREEQRRVRLKLWVAADFMSSLYPQSSLSNLTRSRANPAPAHATPVVDQRQALYPREAFTACGVCGMGTSKGGGREEERQQRE